MGWYGGTVNAGTANGNVDAFLDQLQTKIPLHPAWTFVERITSATAGRYCDVYKCAGASNGVKDFYVGFFVLNDTAAQAMIMCFEDYDPATNLASKYSPASGNVDSSTDTYMGTANPCEQNETVASTAGFISTDGTGGWGTAARSWAMAINERRLVLMTVTATSATYAGLLELPTGSRWRNGVVSGLASTNAISSTRAAYGTNTHSNLDAMASVNPSFNGVDPNFGKRLVGKWVVAEVGAFFGYLSDCIYLGPSGLVATTGDTVTINGKTYRCLGESSTTLWADEAD